MVDWKRRRTLISAETTNYISSRRVLLFICIYFEVYQITHILLWVLLLFILQIFFIHFYIYLLFGEMESLLLFFIDSGKTESLCMFVCVFVHVRVCVGICVCAVRACACVCMCVCGASVIARVCQCD